MFVGIPRGNRASRQGTRHLNREIKKIAKAKSTRRALRYSNLRLRSSVSCGYVLQRRRYLIGVKNRETEPRERIVVTCVTWAHTTETIRRRSPLPVVFPGLASRDMCETHRNRRRGNSGNSVALPSRAFLLSSESNEAAKVSQKNCGFIPCAHSARRVLLSFSRSLLARLHIMYIRLWTALRNREKGRREGKKYSCLFLYYICTYVFVGGRVAVRDEDIRDSCTRRSRSRACLNVAIAIEFRSQTIIDRFSFERRELNCPFFFSSPSLARVNNIHNKYTDRQIGIACEMSRCISH